METAPRATEDDEPRQSCLQLTASLRSPSRAPAAMAEGPLAPWGVQLAGNFSKSIALASFGRARQAYASILGEGTSDDHWHENAITGTAAAPPGAGAGLDTRGRQRALQPSPLGWG